MSASTEKKLRAENRAAGTDKKMLALQEEEKKKKKSKTRWTWGTIGVVILIIAILFFSSNIFYRSTTALTIGDKSYGPDDVTYHYANQYYNFYSMYGSYASIFGLDTSYGISGLGSQQYAGGEEGYTWKDYFLDAARSEMAQLKALCDYAGENGIALEEDDLEALNTSLEDLEASAKENGYANAKKYLKAAYGDLVTLDTVEEANTESALANKAISFYRDSLEYTDEELEDYYVSLNGSSDLFTYAYYYIAAETVESTDADGNTTTAANEETLTAAKADAKAIVAAFEADENEYDSIEAKLNAAIASVVAPADGEEQAVCTYSKDALGSSLGSSYSSWLMEEGRAEGDIEVLEYTDYGYYVVVFESRNDNSSDADGDGTIDRLAIAKGQLTDTAVSEWIGTLSANYEAADGFGMKFVG